MNKKYVITISFIILFFFSCTTQNKIAENTITEPKEVLSSQITLLFGGDIMAHKPNFNMRDYSVIWKDVAPIISSSDASFANIETTIMDDKENESYPTFSVQSSYLQAAINAGFNVFSLANNHTNDQGLKGILSTKKWAQTTEKETKLTDRPVYFSGLKENGNFSTSYFEVKGWKILFVAMTELLNRPDYSSEINYVPPKKANRAHFINYIKLLRQQNPCDLFIVSVHTADPEYDFTIYENEKDFFYTLINDGTVDVVWANHPHVAKNWEIIGNSKDNTLNKMIMYANGNTISAQRWEPSFSKPETLRDYTGEGYLIQATFSKKKYNDGSSLKPEITNVKPILITTFIDSKWQFVVKKLDDNFIQALNDTGFLTWSKYLKERKNLMERIQGQTVWQ